jgi:hypothetical protein
MSLQDVEVKEDKPMRIDDPISLARSCRTARQAARAMVALEAETSLADDRPEAWYLDADRAIDSLRQRFPGATQLDAYTEPPGLSPTARKRLWSDPTTPSMKRLFCGTPPTAPATEEATDAGRVFDRLANDRDPRPGPRRRGADGSTYRHRGIKHTLELAALLTAVVMTLTLLARHARRRPRHAAAAGVVLLAAFTGRPSIVFTGAVITAMVAIARRGGLPRPPKTLRRPRAPRWPW